MIIYKTKIQQEVYSKSWSFAHSMLSCLPSWDLCKMCGRPMQEFFSCSTLHAWIFFHLIFPCMNQCFFFVLVFIIIIINIIIIIIITGHTQYELACVQTSPLPQNNSGEETDFFWGRGDVCTQAKYGCVERCSKVFCIDRFSFCYFLKMFFSMNVIY